jgi:hypothetical protein
MSDASIGSLAQHTGLSEAELQRQAEQLVDVKTGKIRALSALDAALLVSQTGVNQGTAQSFEALAAASQQAHVMESPVQAFTRTASNANALAGYAETPPEKPTPNLGQVLDRAGKVGTSRLGGLLKESELTGDAPVQTPGPTTSDTQGATGKVDQLSRDLQFEQLKNEMQKMASAQQCISNVIATMNDEAMTAIRNAKA